MQEDASDINIINQVEELPSSSLPLNDLTRLNGESGAKKRTVEEIFGGMCFA